MTIEEFINKVNEGLSKSQLMEYFNISERTVRRKCKKFGIKNVKESSSNLCKSCGKELTGNQRKHCSNNCKQGDFRARHNLSNNTFYHEFRDRGLMIKLSQIEKTGGCLGCGYKSNVASLTFHHKNPSIKSFYLSMRNMGRKDLTIIDEELSKCDILCMNCHMEVESPNLNIRNGANAKHFSTTTGLDRKIQLLEEFGSCCMKCGYNKNYRSLHFHHRNPIEKKFHLNIHDCQLKSIDKLRIEALKCDVLCGNCHMEEHYPHLNI